MKAKSIMLKNGFSFSIVEIYPEIYTLIFTSTRIDENNEIVLKQHTEAFCKDSIKKVAEAMKEVIK